MKNEKIRSYRHTFFHNFTIISRTEFKKGKFSISKGWLIFLNIFAVFLKARLNISYFKCQQKH